MIDRLIFTHVPRTGGLSVNASLRPHFEGREFYINHSGELSAQRDRIISAWPNGLYVHGHFRLIDLDAIVGMPGPFTAFSIIREPIARLVSLYFFIQREQAAIPGLYRATEGRDFDYFLSYGVENLPGTFCNAQCYWLGTEPTASSAMRNVQERYLLVADQTRLEEAVHAVAAAIGVGLSLPAVKGPDGRWYTAAEALVHERQNAGGWSGDVDEYATPTAKRLIEQTSAEDFALRERIITDHAGMWSRAA